MDAVMIYQAVRLTFRNAVTRCGLTGMTVLSTPDCRQCRYCADGVNDVWSVPDYAEASTHIWLFSLE